MEKCGVVLISVLHLICPQYGIVLDAGSSHTNLYIYKWPAEKENDTGVVQQLEECQVKGKTGAGHGTGRAGHRDVRGMRICRWYFIITVK